MFMGLLRAALAVLYVGAWVWVFASPPDLNDSADALLFALAVLAAHVAWGYAMGEWWALLLAMAPLLVEPFFEDPAWALLVGIAYGFPAAILLAIGVGMVKLQTSRRRAKAQS